MKRTLENCSLLKKHSAKQYDGKCEGLGRNGYDDEPCDTCKACSLHYINVEERGG